MNRLQPAAGEVKTGSLIILPDIPGIIRLKPQYIPVKNKGRPIVLRIEQDPEFIKGGYHSLFTGTDTDNVTIRVRQGETPVRAIPGNGCEQKYPRFGADILKHGFSFYTW
jgi:hypothetical protein